MGYRIGIDIGGTFTDLISFDREGETVMVKTPTDNANPARGVIIGLTELASLNGLALVDLLNQTDVITHGTTTTTNAMLEFKGAKTGLITTRGFRDDIELRRGYKEQIFNPRLGPPNLICRRRHRLTVNERIDRTGAVVTPLDGEEVIRIAHKFKEEQIESVAVCFLFSFLNPAHEQQVAKILSRECPRMHISLSHQVLPQIREFERLSTTLINSYTMPKMKSYLQRLSTELAHLGFKNNFLIMLSSGGAMDAVYASRYPVYALLSGPSAGVVACTKLIGEQLNLPDLIAFDMGGTSCDISVIKGGRAAVTTSCWFSRYRVAIPMLDIHTIGAGGGSIARVDPGGALKVGPESAGAQPGPACYGRGGKAPTVTDANLLLGYLDKNSFLGGKMKLDREAAARAVEEQVAKPLGLDLMEAADGIFRITNSNMNNAIRLVTVQRGYDPADFTLVAFGGNGAVHAGLLAQELGMNKVIVPRFGTVFSARGMLNADIVINKVATYRASSLNYDLATVNTLLASMLNDVWQELPDLVKKNSPLIDSVSYDYAIDLHYRGEMHEITVPLRTKAGQASDEHIQQAVVAFHAAHEALHTFSNPDECVYFMNLGLKATVALVKPSMEKQQHSGADSADALVAHRRVFFGPQGLIETPVYNGKLLVCGNTVQGPCIIEEVSTTVIIYPGQRALLTELNNIEITLSGERVLD